MQDPRDPRALLVARREVAGEMGAEHGPAAHARGERVQPLHLRRRQPLGRAPLARDARDHDKGVGPSAARAEEGGRQPPVGEEGDRHGRHGALPRPSRGRVDDPEKRTYLIAPYETTAESLVVKVFSLSAFQRMIEQGELAGEIRDGKFLDSVVVTASSEERAAAIARKGVPALVEEDSVLKYQTLRQNNRKKSPSDQRPKQ